MKYREVIYEIWSDLKLTKDDADISLYSVLYWVCVFGDRLKSQHIEKKDSGYFLTTFGQVPVESDSTTGRKYITLPTSIYDFNDDKGINYISYDYTIDINNEPTFTSVTFTRTSPTQSKALYWTEEETPTPSNPYFYRIQNSIYFLGIENINVANVEVGLFSTFDPRNVKDLEDEFDFPQELLPILIQQVLGLGKFVLQVPMDRTNTGTTGAAVAMPKTAALDPIAQQQAQDEQDQVNMF